ncbi:MAG: hypothetical protein QOF51_1948, partial [Chloroflexota bacterium]|nr:hypothetical protein [Chloroflexota bacterium]
MTEQFNLPIVGDGTGLDRSSELYQEELQLAL